jgi:hypothetical protein
MSGVVFASGPDEFLAAHRQLSELAAAIEGIDLDGFIAQLYRLPPAVQKMLDLDAGGLHLLKVLSHSAARFQADVRSVATKAARAMAEAAL